MALSPLISRKLQEYENHCLTALDFAQKSDAEHALGDFRKSAEAAMKILVIKKFGDHDGEQIVIGQMDCQLNTITTSKRLEYQDFLDILKAEKLTNTAVFFRLIDLQQRTNPSVHNPNSATDFERDLKLCAAQSFEVTKYLLKELSEPISQKLDDAYNGQINALDIAQLNQSPWEALYGYVDEFSKHQKYLLITPPNFAAAAKSNLDALSYVDWAFILDFDPASKETGLFQTFDSDGNNSFVPLTIKQKGQRGLVGSGSYKNINWLFANGLSTIPDTTAASIRAWRTMKYHSFLKELLSDFFSKDVSRYAIIYLWDDVDFLEEIVRVIADVDEVSLDLVKHIFLTQNQQVADRLANFEKYSIDFQVYNLSVEQLLVGLNSVLKRTTVNKSGILVPARTKSDENALVDISDIHQKLLDSNIVTVHSQIEQNDAILIGNDIPSFFEGEQITWKNLSMNLEAERNRYQELNTKIGEHLMNAKKSLKFELLHKPGAGGTTLAHRIGFDYKSKFPVVLIERFDKVSTYQSLNLFLSRVNQTTLAIVEASNVGLNDLEDLIRSCNASKQNVCFLYIRRVLSPIKTSEFSVFLNDAIADLNEKNRFVAKANPYTKNKTFLTDLASRPANECEVIDFPLAINEEGYSSGKLLDYIKTYIAKLPEEQVRFSTYSAMIYYYTQRSASEVVFRSLFPNGLAHSLRKTPIADQYIRKILIQEYDGQSHFHREYWRPRFSKFAECILMCILGGAIPENWKDHINLHATEFIKVFKANNEHLVDETRNILKGMFFERNNEDLLGTAEQWNSPVINEQFSLLLRDIANKQKQKAVLVALVEAYPDENHFLGHLGRFLYEKAEEEQEFIEAEQYIQKALETSDGEDDYNLQHLGGMCFRRHLEFLKRNSRTFSTEQIIELTDRANEYFNASRNINPYNIHAYVAQIQTLILAIDMGKEISNLNDKLLFIADARNRWFLEQLMTVRNLIYQAQALVEQQESLGTTTKIIKAKTYVKSGEGRYFELLGHYDSSIATFQKLIETVDRTYRPAMRRMFIETSLLKKVHGNRSKIDNAWAMLKTDEIKLIEKTINDDILQDTTNIYSLRLWFKLVRYSSIETPIEEIISRLKVWFEHSENSPILKLESAFYLYVLNALIAMRSDSISQQHKNEANYYIKKCIELSKNTKFIYEYLGKAGGIDGLINHRERAQTDNDFLERVNGTIIVIASRQAGRISLPSGLEAFFVPYAGDYVQGIDETEDVTFQLGFRHDGLFAIDVRRVTKSTAEKSPVVTEPEPQSGSSLPVEIAEDLKEPQPIEEITIDEDQEEEKETLPGLKIVGKIDLSSVYGSKKRK